MLGRLCTCLLFLLVIRPSTAGYVNERALTFCEAYVECYAVSRLEERLCLGNSRLRPFWLPGTQDENNCHETLKGDYTQLGTLELNADNDFAKCLIENTSPDTKVCEQRILLTGVRFSSGRTIDYVPTRCFAGLDRRVQRQCHQIRDCCPAIEKCVHLLTSGTAIDKLKSSAVEMRKRAADCQKGLPMSRKPVPTNDVTESPFGTITVSFTDKEHSSGKEVSGQLVVSNPVKFDGKTQHRGIGTVEVGPATEADFDGRALASDPQFSFPKGGTGTVEEVARESEAEFSASLSKSREHSLHDPDTIAIILAGKVNTTHLEMEDMKKNSRAGYAMQKPTVSPNIAPNIGLSIDVLSNLSKDYGSREERERTNGKYSTQNKVTLSQAADEALSSLSKAGEIAKGSGGMGMATKGLEISRNGKVVTSYPMVFVKEGMRRQGKPAPGCGRRALASKTLKMEQVLSLVGDDGNATQIIQVKEKLEEWQKNLHGTNSSDGKYKEVDEALRVILAYFDKMELTTLPTNSSGDDYDEADAEIAGTLCDPLDTEEYTDNKLEDLDNLESSGATPEAGEIGLSVDGPHEETGSQEGDGLLLPSGDMDALEELKTASSPCSAYLRCRSHMHLALDGCAWRFASPTVLLSLADSPETILFRGKGLCGDEAGSIGTLKSVLQQRNNKLSNCMEDFKNIDVENSCTPSEHEYKHYEDAIARIISAKHNNSAKCFQDANLIQETCSSLRACCPHFDRCREDTMDLTLEQAIISQTAQINERNQECLKKSVKQELQRTVRAILNVDSDSISTPTSEQIPLVRRLRSIVRTRFAL